MTDSLLTVRASSLPLVMTCPGALQSSEVRINSTSEPARLGTAAHLMLQPVAEGGSPDWEQLEQVAALHDCSPDELRFLVAAGVKLWREIGTSFPDATTEVELSAEVGGIVLTGHADIVSHQGEIARGGDFKTGRKDHNYSEQMRGYCALLLLDDPGLVEVSFTILWLRDSEAETYSMDRAGLQQWTQEFAALASWNGVYQTGNHCQWCHRSHECPAANALARRDVAAFLDGANLEKGLAALPPERLIALSEQASRVSSLAYRVREAIKAHVRDNGDVCANGQRLTIGTRSNRALDPLTAWPVLESAGFSDGDFAEVMKLSVSKVEKLTARKAGCGKGAAAIRELNERLTEAGALTTEDSEILVTRRA